MLKPVIAASMRCLLCLSAQTSSARQTASLVVAEIDCVWSISSCLGQPSYWCWTSGQIALSCSQAVLAHAVREFKTTTASAVFYQLSWNRWKRCRHHLMLSGLSNRKCNWFWILVCRHDLLIFECSWRNLLGNSPESVGGNCYIYQQATATGLSPSREAFPLLPRPYTYGQLWADSAGIATKSRALNWQRSHLRSWAMQTLVGSWNQVGTPQSWNAESSCFGMPPLF